MASMRPGAQSRSIPKLLVPLIFPSALLGCLKTRREDWMSIPAYFEKHAPDHIKAKRKTLAAKKAWITKETSPH